MRGRAAAFAQRGQRGLEQGLVKNHSISPSSFIPNRTLSSASGRSTVPVLYEARQRGLAKGKHDQPRFESLRPWKSKQMGAAPTLWRGHQRTLARLTVMVRQVGISAHSDHELSLTWLTWLESWSDASFSLCLGRRKPQQRDFSEKRSCRFTSEQASDGCPPAIDPVDGTQDSLDCCLLA